MALGPDPNRWQPRDPETVGGELGDPGSTRFKLSSWAIAFIAVVVVLVVVVLVL